MSADAFKNILCFCFCVWRFLFVVFLGDNVCFLCFKLALLGNLFVSLSFERFLLDLVLGKFLEDITIQIAFQNFIFNCKTYFTQPIYFYRQY